MLPTGRNIHALDPYRMPFPAAYERGREIARKLIDQHRQTQGTYPETIAVMLWGLDAIKTKDESLGILLELVGAAPLKESSGRIVRYKLQPLDQLDHPRIDVLANLSGSSGAYEISQRMTAMIGWAGTADFKENWVYDQAAATYALDAEMAERLRQANPEAFRNIVGRLLEARSRSFWHTSDDKLEKLQQLYGQTMRN